MKSLTVITWDEFTSETTTYPAEAEGYPQPGASNGDLVAYARKHIYGEEDERSGEVDAAGKPLYLWNPTESSRSANTVTIEWRSVDGCLATSTFIWY
jgi:hypothetical protein